MFFIFFGAFWTFLTSQLLIVCLTMEPNFIPAVLFSGAFVAVGVGIIGLGIVQVVQSIKFSKNAKERVALVADKYNVRRTTSDSNGHRHHYTVRKAVVFIYLEEQGFEHYEVNFPYSKSNIQVGDFINVKHYKKRVEVLNKADEFYIPYELREKLREEVSSYGVVE